MYEALLKATPEYQKIAASLQSPALPRCSVCRPQAGRCCMPPCKRILGGCCAS